MYYVVYQVVETELMILKIYSICVIKYITIIENYSVYNNLDSKNNAVKNLH